MRLLSILIALLLSAGLARAHVQAQPPSPDRIPTTTSVSWDRMPAPWFTDFPPIAAVLEIEGRATLRCMALADGSVGACEALSDDYGLGFNAAAIRVVQRGRVNPRTVDGVAEDATFTVTIPFLFEPIEPLPPYEGPEPSEAVLAWARDVLAHSGEAAAAVADLRDSLSAEDWGRVRPHLEGAFRQNEALLMEALAFGLARQVPPSVVAAIEAGQPLPPASAPFDFTAMDQVDAAEREIFALARQTFCAENGCPPS